MKVIVTSRKAEERYNVPLLRLEGEDITDTIDTRNDDFPQEMLSDTVNHILLKERLVYFSHLDFAYWIKRNEFDVSMER